MFRKIHFCFIGSVITSILIFSNASIAQTPNRKLTTWSAVDKSMTELLDSGWKIISHSIHRVVIAPYTNGASDEETFSYILHKNGKYIDCLIKDPRLSSSYSGCRQLN
jgi:hypothetical protein